MVMWLREHSRRTLVERVDFITAPPGPTKQGPTLIVCTPKAMFVFDRDSGELMLTGLFPSVSVDDVINNMAFRPRIKEPLSVLEPVTNEELQFLNKLDPASVRYS